MKNIFTILVIAIFISGCQQGEFFKDAICIENVSVIHPEEGLVENQTVIIQGEKIFKVVASSELQLSPENKIIDGTGKYLMPGLWDTHVHFAYIEELAPRMFDLFLANGITSVRDTGGEINFVKKWKDKALANPTDAPRVMIAGPLLDGMPNVYNGSTPALPPLSYGLASTEAVMNKVNELDSIGVDFLKAYEMLSPEQFKLVAKMGKERGLKVTGHVPLSMNVTMASNAGLNSMEHLRNLELSCASNADELWQERQRILEAEKDSAGGVLRSKLHELQRETAVKNYDDNKANEVLAVLAKNKTWQIPTLALNTGLVNRHFEKSEWKESYASYPSEIKKEWITGIEMTKKRKVTAFKKEHSEWFLKMTKKIHDAKIDIMAGTDCPIFYLTPGLSLHEELVVLVKAGLSPLEAIKTATINPAAYFNMQDELGLVKENFWADLLLLDANPINNIQHTKRIHAVIKQGKLFDRKQLDELLQK